MGFDATDVRRVRGPDAPVDPFDELMRIEITPNEAAYRIVKYAPDAFDVDEFRAHGRRHPRAAHP